MKTHLLQHLSKTTESIGISEFVMVSRMCNNTLRVSLAFALNWKTKNERDAKTRWRKEQGADELWFMPDRCSNTNAFLENVSHLTRRPIPDELRKERGRRDRCNDRCAFQDRTEEGCDPRETLMSHPAWHDFCMNSGLRLLIIATGTESKEFALGCAGGRKPDRA